MFNYNKLRGKIKEKFQTQDKFATALGIGRVSLSERLNNTKQFRSIEISKACELLGIDSTEIGEYFFECEVQKSEQTKRTAGSGKIKKLYEKKGRTRWKNKKS